MVCNFRAAMSPRLLLLLLAVAALPSQAEKAGGRDDAVAQEEAKFCSIDNPECESCQ